MDTVIVKKLVAKSWLGGGLFFRRVVLSDYFLKDWKKRKEK